MSVEVLFVLLGVYRLTWGHHIALFVYQLLAPDIIPVSIDRCDNETTKEQPRNTKVQKIYKHKTKQYTKNNNQPWRLGLFLEKIDYWNFDHNQNNIAHSPHQPSWHPRHVSSIRPSSHQNKNTKTQTKKQLALVSWHLKIKASEEATKTNRWTHLYKTNIFNRRRKNEFSPSRGASCKRLSRFLGRIGENGTARWIANESRIWDWRKDFGIEVDLEQSDGWVYHSERMKLRMVKVELNVLWWMETCEVEDEELMMASKATTIRYKDNHNTRTKWVSTFFFFLPVKWRTLAWVVLLSPSSCWK